MSPEAKEQQSAAELEDVPCTRRNEGEDQRSGGELEEDSCTKRKRLRRVSFAETTIHIYTCDEESESPAESNPGQDSRFSDSDPDDDKENGVLFKFGRGIDSSSPGSAADSVTSNEDDNFFGPVSTSFISSGRPSDSGMSEDINHDITLDSTAFSLHFRNLIPPHDHLTNSAGSLRTPTVDTPLGLSYGSEQTGERTSSVGQISNVSGDLNNFSQIAGRSHSYDYGKLSDTLDALMNQVKLRMKQISPKKDSRFSTSCCISDEVGSLGQLSKDGKEVGIKSSVCEEPNRYFHCPVVLMSPPTNNESLFHAKIKALETQTNKEDIEKILSHASVDSLGKGHEAVYPEAVVANGQNSKLMAPSHGEVQDDLNEEACHIHKQPFRSTTSEGNSYSNLHLHSISSVPSTSKNVEQKLESTDTVHTPENVIKSLYSSFIQEVTPFSFNQKKEHFLSQANPTSSKIFSIADRKKRDSYMKKPDNVVKTFQPSSLLKGSTSRFPHQLGSSVHSVDVVGVKGETIEHGNRISAVENSAFDGNISHTALDNRNNNMKTPDTAFKQLSALNTSISSLQDKMRQPLEPPDFPQRQSFLNSVRELSASLKMELKGHEETISAIKTSMSRSRLKPKTNLDRESSASKKDISLIASLQFFSDEVNDAANQLLPQSISELNLQGLSEAEDFLAEYETARKYEELFMTLKIPNFFVDSRQKGILAARSLLGKLGLAKARNQLKLMKLAKLHERAQTLQSRTEECRQLKSIFAQPLLAKAVEPHESSDLTQHQAEHTGLPVMKRELEILEEKTKLLSESLWASCGLKSGKPSCDAVIKAAEELVMRRSICRKIQQQARLWRLSDVVMKNTGYEIVLSYCDLLFQRFTISRFLGHESLAENTSSNASYIARRYPNMNAHAAFEFVFELDADRSKLVNSNGLFEKTVETDLRLGTLMDVMNEILRSRLELPNLMASTFERPASGELELRLCFFGFAGGGKLSLGIDMAVLRCGMHPSDLSELRVQVCRQQTTVPLDAADQIIGAVHSMDSGHLVILRLCQCVSQAVQSCSHT